MTSPNGGRSHKDVCVKCVESAKTIFLNTCKGTLVFVSFINFCVVCHCSNTGFCIGDLTTDVQERLPDTYIFKAPFQVLVSDTAL